MRHRLQLTRKAGREERQAEAEAQLAAWGVSMEPIETVSSDIVSIR